MNLYPHNPNFRNEGPKKIGDPINGDGNPEVDPTIKKKIREILESHIAQQQEGEGKDPFPKTEDNLDLESIILPPAHSYSRRETENIKLLLSIAELGDLREVPLLQEMLGEATNEWMIILIKEIVFKLLSDNPGKNESNKIADNLVYLGDHYIYNYLFKSVDKDSQLILLEQILEIGEQREVDFLKSLFQHPDKCIRKRAISFCHKLEKRLERSRKSPNEYSPQVVGVFGDLLQNGFPNPLGFLFNDLMESYIKADPKKLAYRNDGIQIGEQCAYKSYEAILRKVNDQDTLFSIDFEVGVSEVTVTKDIPAPDLLKTPKEDGFNVLMDIRKSIHKFHKKCTRDFGHKD